MRLYFWAVAEGRLWEVTVPRERVEVARQEGVSAGRIEVSEEEAEVVRLVARLGDGDMEKGLLAVGGVVSKLRLMTGK